MKKRIISALCAVFLSAFVLVSCSTTKSNSDLKLSTICTAVRDAYGEEYLPVQQPEETAQQMLGIDKSLYDEIYFEMPMISVQPDKFVAVKAKEGKAEEVEKILNNYRQKLLEQGAQYPSNLPLAQASQVVREGDFVFFVLLGQVPFEVLDTGDDAKIAESAKQQIQKGVDAIKNSFKK